MIFSGKMVFQMRNAPMLNRALQDSLNPVFIIIPRIGGNMLSYGENIECEPSGFRGNGTGEIHGRTWLVQRERYQRGF